MNRKYTFLFLFLLTYSFAFAWGTTGHRVVAEIAERHLTKKAKKNIHKLIGNQCLAYWGNWPDFIKSDESWKEAGSWHYINFPAELYYQDVLEKLHTSTDVNLYKRTLYLIEELETKDLDLKTQQHYLYFIIHFIGDAHQPLHIGREKDLGGNKITIEWFGEKTNLHSLWDSKLIDFEKYSYTEYARVLDIGTKEENKKWMEGGLIDWLYDSYIQAEEIYAGVQPGEKLSYRYQYLNKDRLENQLLKGGLRLAKILNSIFE